MMIEPRVVEKPSEIYNSLGPLRPFDLSMLDKMSPKRRQEYLRNVYGRATYAYAHLQYRKLTGMRLVGHRHDVEAIRERSTN